MDDPGALMLIARRIWAVLAVSLLVGSVSHPAHAVAKKRRPAAKKAVPKISDTEWLVQALSINKVEFNPDLTKCEPKRFSILAAALSANRKLLHTEQGEFETSAEYDERVAGIGAVMSSESIMVCEPLDDNDDVPFKYDADSGTFNGSFHNHHLIYRDSKSLGSYQSSTAMGAKATVKASIDFDYNIKLSRRPGGNTPCLRNGGYSNEFAFPVDRGAAPQLKYGGSIAYVAKLVTPYVEYSETKGKPTIDYPYDEYTNTVDVLAKLEKVMILDGSGGIVWSCELVDG